MEEFHSNVKRNETESGEIQIEGKSSEQSEKGHSKQRELKIKPRPAIHTVLKEITDNKLSARTPILTDIIADKNRFRVKVSAVSELQKFAEQVSESKHLQKDTERLAAENEKLKNLCFLKTRPIRMELNRKGGGVNRLSVDDETDGCEEKKRECEQRRDKENGEKNRVEVDVVLKVFLNGSPLVHSHSTNHDQFVSVCLSVVNTNEQHNHNDDEVTQNILEEEWLIVSVYLRQPHTDHNPYRRDFKMKFSPQLEKGEKGLLKFIEKRELEKYIAQDGSVDVGVLIQFESSAAAL